MKDHIEMIIDIPQYSEWREIEAPETGWSVHHKFKVTDDNGQVFLLRVANISSYDERKAEFDNFERLFSLGINVSEPVSFGVCNKGNSVYMLMGWIDGVAVEDVIRTYNSHAQYELGIKSGKILRQIHDNSPVDSDNNWASKFGSHVDEIILAYFNTKISIPHENMIMDYLNKNRHLLEERPQVIMHGDFHVGNLIIMPNGEIGVIDCETCNPGDAWFEFGGIVWAARLSGVFAKGQVDGYFGEQAPNDFFKLLAFYIGVYALEHVVRSAKHRSNERPISGIIKNTSFMAAMFENFTVHIPDWYLL